MPEKRRMPAGEKPQRPAGEKQQRPAARRPKQPAETPAAPVSTGDMQEVGATRPEEVPARRRTVKGEPPVHENPGGQQGG